MQTYFITNGDGTITRSGMSRGPAYLIAQRLANEHRETFFVDDGRAAESDDDSYLGTPVEPMRDEPDPMVSADKFHDQLDQIADPMRDLETALRLLKTEPAPVDHRIRRRRLDEARVALRKISDALDVLEGLAAIEAQADAR
jgi:hypothetical protein